MSTQKIKRSFPKPMVKEHTKKIEEMKIVPLEHVKKHRRFRDRDVFASDFWKRWGRINPEDEFKWPSHEDRVDYAPYPIYTNRCYAGDHSLEDIGKYYCIPDAILEKIPETLLSKWFKDEIHFTGKYQMVRKDGYDIVQEMKRINNQEESVLNNSVVGLYGRRGTGKSVTLCYVAQYAIANDWLILATEGSEFSKDIIGRIIQSPVNSEVYDQPGYTQQWFKNLMSQENVLKKVVLKAEYDYDWELLQNALQEAEEEKNVEKEKDSEEEENVEEISVLEREKTLYDLVHLAAIDIDSAPDILYDFVEEIRVIEEVPVLVAIDRLNRWEHESPFINPKIPTAKLRARSLSMVDAFSLFQYEGPNRGLSVFALTQCGTSIMSRKHLADATYSIEIPRYSVEELRNCVYHYAATGFLHEEVTPNLLARFKGIAGAVPTDCLQYAAIG